MLHKINIQAAPEVAFNPERLPAEAARELGISPARVKRVDVLRRGIDARRRHVTVNLTLGVHVDEVDLSATLYEPEAFPTLAADAPQAVVVGAGPAGLFAALRLIQLGVRPVVLERGKNVDERRRDMARISREGIVDPDSNYCFGEGGAGAYSTPAAASAGRWTRCFAGSASTARPPTSLWTHTRTSVPTVCPTSSRPCARP